MSFCDNVDKVSIQGCDVNIINPAQLKKLKKTELMVVVRKYQEIIEKISENNNSIVDRFQEAHEAFVSLAHCIHGVDNDEKLNKLKTMCKEVVDKEAESKTFHSEANGETFENISFEGKKYNRCVGGADNNNVYDDDMDCVGRWDEENGKIIFLK